MNILLKVAKLASFELYFYIILPHFYKISPVKIFDYRSNIRGYYIIFLEHKHSVILYSLSARSILCDIIWYAFYRDMQMILRDIIFTENITQYRKYYIILTTEGVNIEPWLADESNPRSVFRYANLFLALLPYIYVVMLQMTLFCRAGHSFTSFH